MSHINTLVLSGNLTADPIARGGGKGASLSIASNRQYQANGEWVNEVLFIDATAWSFNATRCLDKLVKGDSVAITGRLELNTYTPNDGGPERRQIRVQVNSIESPAFLGNRWARVAKDDEPLPVAADVKPTAPSESEQLVGVATSVEDDIPF